MTKAKVLSCPFCGCHINALDTVGECYHYRVGIVHPSAVDGEWLCPLNGRKIALKAWNTRSKTAIN